MSTPAESNHEAPLTAADLDRLAHEWSERRVVFNGVEFRAKQDAARTERLVAALPSLLALARRGLEAEASVAHAIGCDVDTRRDRDEWRQIAEKAEFHAVGLNNTRMDLESKLTAALAEVERLRGRLERATNFSWRNGAVWLARPEGATTWHVYEELGSCGAALVGTYDSLDAAWSAAEAQSARPSAPKGGPA